MLFMVMVFLGVSKNADAKDKYVTERGVNRNTTIKGISVVAKQYEEAGSYKYKIIMKKNGVKKTIRLLILQQTEKSFITVQL